MKLYKKIQIYYFTGTGNSGNVALWFDEVAKAKGIDTEIINIAKITEFPIKNPVNDSLLIFISPIHGFNYPPVMISFINHFPKGKNDIVLMNTRAGMLIHKFITPGLSGIAFYYAAMLFKIKGYSINGMLPVDMPSNWISLHPGLNQHTVLFIHQKMKLKVEKYAQRYLDGKRNYIALREIIQDMLISPISLGYFFLGRYILSKTFYANSNCDNCDLCIKQCPVNAIIKVNNRPFWKLSCESCMRCMSNCPKRAIEAAHGFIFVVSLMFNVIILGSLYHFVPNLISQINPFLFNWIIQFLIFLLLLIVSYRISHYLLRYKWYERCMTYTSFTFYKFWGRRYKALKNFK
jgi:Pyruvate/2-oxoacid:ferredoxin oxidoreductase delta subunit